MIGFRSVFSRLFISVFLALIAFAIAMFLWVQVIHNNSDTLRNRAIARQIATQIDPFLTKYDQYSKDNQLVQARFNLMVIKKSFEIFDESLNAKIGLYDAEKRLILQTDNGRLPKELIHNSTFVGEIMPTLFSGNTPRHVQVKTHTGYTIWYESRTPPSPKSKVSGFFNLFTGMALLVSIMAVALWGIAKNITRRLDTLSKQMVLMGDGDFSVRVPQEGNDEISALAYGFNQAAQKIEQLISANNLLLAHASHEFRTPITRIRLQIEMMDMLTQNLDGDTKAKFDKRAAAVNRDLTGLNDLIESILLVSRLDAGHALEQMQTVDFLELISQECQHYPEATLQGTSVSIDAQPKLLTHLIRNLLNNALIHGVPPIQVYVYGCQHSDDAPIIPEALLDSKLDTSPIQDTQETNAKDEKDDKSDKSFFNRFKKSAKTNTAKDNFAVLAVIDQGEGIAVDKRDDIFSPFVRLKQEKKGSGLGLSLVAQIVQMHNGSIITDTWQGHTRFLVVLPIQQKSLIDKDKSDKG